MNLQVIDGRIKVDPSELRTNPSATAHRGYWIVPTELAYAVYTEDGWYEGSHYDPVEAIARKIKRGVK